MCPPQNTPTRTAHRRAPGRELGGDPAIDGGEDEVGGAGVAAPAALDQQFVCVCLGHVRKIT